MKKGARPQKHQLNWIFGDKYLTSSGAEAEFEQVLAQTISETGRTKKDLQAGIHSSVLKKYYTLASPEIKREIEDEQKRQYDEAFRIYNLKEQVQHKNIEDATEEERWLSVC